MTTIDFRNEQRRVAWRMGSALVLTIVVLVAAFIVGSSQPAIPLADRLQFALRTDTLVVGWLLAAIANVARLRFFSEDDIAGSGAGGGTTRVRNAAAILQNTLEQVVLAVVTHMIVATTFGHPQPILVALTCLFSVGRLSFWAGYGRGAHGRAFGFALTFYPSAIMLVTAGSLIALGKAG
ncbi:MAPEG family protein [Sphingomonas sp. RS2018]